MRTNTLLILHRVQPKRKYLTECFGIDNQIVQSDTVTSISNWSFSIRQIAAHCPKRRGNKNLKSPEKNTQFFLHTLYAYLKITYSKNKTNNTTPETNK